VATSFEAAGGVQIWLFSLCGCLELSAERSHVYKFQAAEKYLSPAEPDCTCRIHQKKFADHDITL